MGLKTRLIMAAAFVGTAAVSVVVLLYWVRPQAKTWFDEEGSRLTASREILIQVTAAVANYWYLIPPPVFFLATLFVVLPELRSSRRQDQK